MIRASTLVAMFCELFLAFSVVACRFGTIFHVAQQFELARDPTLLAPVRNVIAAPTTAFFLLWPRSFVVDQNLAVCTSPCLQLFPLTRRLCHCFSMV